MEIKKIISLWFLIQIGFVCQAEAQVNRSIGSSQYRNQSSSAKKEKKDPIDVSVEYLTKELDLDAFQVPAVRSYLEEHQKENSKIMATASISDGEKTLRIQKVNETLDANIIAILNPDQVEVFQEIKNNRGKKSKGKSKKKDKKKKKE